MRITLEELAKKVNCAKYPARWNDVYDSVMDDFEKNGCPLTDPAYYDALHEKYDVFVNYLDTYKEAAALVGKNEYLSRFLALIVKMLSGTPDEIKADLKEFSQPKMPDGSNDFATDMLTGLAICSQVPYHYNKLKERNYPDDIIIENLRLPEKGVPHYAVRHNGALGYGLIEWFQKAINGNLFRINRLEIEMFAKYGAKAKVFRNENGECVTLAHDLAVHRSGNALGSTCYEDEDGSYIATVTETETEWIGHLFDARGLVKGEKVTLKKSEWILALENGDPVISLHIPADGRLAPVLVDATIEDAKQFIAKYLPEFKYKAFSCHSWLLDPQLEDLLGEDSNIAKFGKRFIRQTGKSGGGAVFSFVFLDPHAKDDLDSLPENTRLTKSLKYHYLDGKCIYETFGCFF